MEIKQLVLMNSKKLFFEKTAKIRKKVSVKVIFTLVIIVQTRNSSGSILRKNFKEKSLKQ